MGSSPEEVSFGARQLSLILQEETSAHVVSRMASVSKTVLCVAALTCKNPNKKRSSHIPDCNIFGFFVKFVLRISTFVIKKQYNVVP